MTSALAPSPERGAVALAFTSQGTVAFLKGCVKLCSRELRMERQDSSLRGRRAGEAGGQD